MIRTILIAGTVFTGFALGGQRAEAVDYRHVDLLALQLQQQAATLQHEFRIHFMHVPQAGHLLSDAAQLYASSARMHHVAHCGGSVYYLRSGVDDIDRLYHHMHSLLHQIEAGAHHGNGPSHGTSKHVWSLMAETGSTIHHLQNCLRPAYVGYQIGYHGGHVGVVISKPVIPKTSVRPSLPKSGMGNHRNFSNLSPRKSRFPN